MKMQTVRYIDTDTMQKCDSASGSAVDTVLGSPSVIYANCGRDPLPSDEMLSLPDYLAYALEVSSLYCCKIPHRLSLSAAAQAARSPGSSTGSLPSRLAIAHCVAILIRFLLCCLRNSLRYHQSKPAPAYLQFVKWRSASSGNKAYNGSDGIAAPNVHLESLERSTPSSHITSMSL